jgi:2-oxoglutarate dehydrogenase complex dehydrogenase (E1) component-like enzyme
MLLKKPIKYFGRKSSASTANGKLKLHKIEEETLLKQAFSE